MLKLNKIFFIDKTYIRFIGDITYKNTNSFFSYIEYWLIYKRYPLQ